MKRFYKPRRNNKQTINSYMLHVKKQTFNFFLKGILFVFGVKIYHSSSLLTNNLWNFRDPCFYCYLTRNQHVAIININCLPRLFLKMATDKKNVSNYEINFQFFSKELLQRQCFEFFRRFKNSYF